MKTFLRKILVIAPLLLLPLVASAQLEETITGWAADAAKQSISQSIGNTLVTPHFCLNHWSLHAKLDDPMPGRSYELREEVTYRPMLGTYSEYGHGVRMNPDMDLGTTATAPDLPGSPVLEDYFCIAPTGMTNSSGAALWIHQTRTQTCSFYLWVDAVQSGINPPGPPYNVTLSTSMQNLPSSCYVAAFGGTYPEKQRYSVPYPGHIVVTLGHSSYVFGWPFACWAGNTYDH